MAVEKVEPRPTAPQPKAKVDKEPGAVTYNLRPTKEQKDEVKDGD